MGMAPLRSTLQFTPLLLFFRAFAGWLNQQPQAFYNDVFVFIRLKQLPFGHISEKHPALHNGC
jgi:hypothetical protein